MTVTRKHLLGVLERFGEVTVAVAGDLLADVYIFARPVGLSREAPVMVLAEESERVTPGGAANAVNNILSLSGRARCVGLVGDDQAGLALITYFAGRGMDTSGIVTAGGAKTSTKTRVFAGDLHTVKQQVFRIDCVPPPRMSAQVEAGACDAIDEVAKACDAWLVSDYDGDFFSERVTARIGAITASGAVTVVDSHRRLAAFPGATCATPNEQEAALATGVPINGDDSAAEAGRRLRRATGARWMLVTRGNRGMALIGAGDAVTHVPIVGGTEIVDVAGAGDTVSAVMTLCLALGEDAVIAAVLASYAASVVVMKTGVATPTPEEVRLAIEKYPPPAV